MRMKWAGSETLLGYDNMKAQEAHISRLMNEIASYLIASPPRLNYDLESEPV
jgi:hypothetical protein